MKKFEIWATFEDGLKARVEIHKTRKNAQAAVDAMEHHNAYEVSVGCEFPHGLPTYSIISKK